LLGDKTEGKASINREPDDDLVKRTRTEGTMGILDSSLKIEGRGEKAWEGAGKSRSR